MGKSIFGSHENRLWHSLRSWLHGGSFLAARGGFSHWREKVPEKQECLRFAQKDFSCTPLRYVLGRFARLTAPKGWMLEFRDQPEKRHSWQKPQKAVVQRVEGQIGARNA